MKELVTKAWAEQCANDSYRQGVEAGRREVVEWVSKHTHSDSLNGGTGGYGMCLNRRQWQAKLKEWGIE